MAHLSTKNLSTVIVKLRIKLLIMAHLSTKNLSTGGLAMKGVPLSVVLYEV
jgi:hypothetical protein